MHIIYYKYYKVFLWKKFSQEDVFCNFVANFGDVSSRKYWGKNIVEAKLNNIKWTLKRMPN